MPIFSGFDPASADLLRELAANNNREFFESHKADYERLVREPMESLLAEAEPKYGRGHVTRANRDLRFSADKSPYRTDSRMWAGKIGCVFLTLTAEGIEVGGGLEPTRDQLERARSAIDSQQAIAAELNEVFDQLESAGMQLAESAVKTAPRGYDADNPAIDLLRRKMYAATLHLKADAPASDIWSTWKRVEPLIDWATKRVGAAHAPRASGR